VASVLVLLLAGALGLSRTASLASGLLFALHPAQSETVTALVGRSDILAFSFAAGSFLLYRRGSSPLWVGLLFLCALLSKESAAFALPWFLLFPARRAHLVSIGAAAALYAALRIAALGSFGIADREIGFLDNPLAAAGLSARMRAAPVLVLEYARLALWPSALSADYSFDQIPVPDSFTDVRVLAGTAVVLALAGAAYRWRIVTLLLPLVGCLHVLFPLGTIFAERLFYLPMLGAALGLGMLLGKPGRAAKAALVAICLLSAIRVHARNRDWRDNETLFRRTVSTSPRSARACFLLGAELLEKKEHAEAARWFESGLEIYPAHVGARMSLGQALVESGDPARAEEAFRSLLASVPSEDVRRAAFDAALAVGRQRARSGDFEGARAAFERALELDDESPEVWNYLGLVSERTEQTGEARERYLRSLELDPDFVPALVNLGSVYSAAGELLRAEEAFRRAIRLAPDSYEAYNGLGISLARQGRREEAVEAFERAVALEPGLEAARENLGRLR
jgi:tetratricopeptide (TPR) repeat protein